MWGLLTPLLVVLSTLLVGFLLSVFFLAGASGLGGGNRSTCGQFLFSAYLSLGRLRNALCCGCDRASQVYPMANTCQVPFFRSLSDVYLFVFGYRREGLFVEVGAYDGESFSNTSGLADLGWRGHYIEPIPQYAAAAQARHAGSAARVKVHTLLIGEKDGEEKTLSVAGPFTSGVEDEISAVSASDMSGMLGALGWSHSSAAGSKVTATTVQLNTFFKQQDIKPGEVDVLVVDTEGFETPILRAFNLKRWAPKLVIVEVQELQARYRHKESVQKDAAELQAMFTAAGYSIVYKDVVNVRNTAAPPKPPKTCACGI
jgi:FkbM family methyltransferase